MTIHSLTRIIWRIKQNDPKLGKTCPITGKTHQKVAILTLKRAIIKEIGHDRRTYYSAKHALIKLGWIKTHKTYLILTNKGLEESC